LDDGHHVIAFARTPSKLDLDTEGEERLNVVAGDVTDAEAVARAVEGADAVLSVLASSADQQSYAITQGMENIVDAMEAHGVHRLVVSMGAGVSDPQDHPKFFNRLLSTLLRILAANVYRDMEHAAEVVRGSDLDWTLVRVPMLSEEDPTGRIKVGYVGDAQLGPRLTRGDLARFMLEQLADDAYLHAAPVVSNPSTVQPHSTRSS
jgi:putative NADH-flavin reductase